MDTKHILYQKAEYHLVSVIYSIPLNKASQLRLRRIFQNCRMDMFGTALESPWVPHLENMYIVGVISYSLFGSSENKFFLEH